MTLTVWIAFLVIFLKVSGFPKARFSYEQYFYSQEEGKQVDRVI